MLVDIFFFFNDTATTEIYTLSLHDALPICFRVTYSVTGWLVPADDPLTGFGAAVTSSYDAYVGHCAAERVRVSERSEEHTSELQSRQYLVCRLLLEKKKNKYNHKNEVTI